MNKNRRRTSQKYDVDNKNLINPVYTKKKRWQYPLITILILIFLLQLVRGIIGNTAKLLSFRTKIIKLEKINKAATRKNQYLKEELEKYTSNSGVEALARNRLQFSKEDETLVIIKNNGDENTNTND